MQDYYNEKGRIFDIQKFSVHDGPGIRTIIFLKGCGMRCRWCCNPESQKREIEIMNTDGKEKIIGEDITAKEAMDKVMRDMVYYRRSGGGLTLSGGECLLQPDFAAALLRIAAENGISTAIESTANVPFENIEKVLPYLDVFLMDIKNMNSEKHKMFTGSGNERILENAAKIAKMAKKLIIRVPVIPTFNATDFEISEIAKFASSLDNVNEIHLLPYHRLGSDKYKWLGREYTLDGISPPGDELMNRFLKIAESFGLKAQIGG